jgi:hypothetical protein
MTAMIMPVHFTMLVDVFVKVTVIEEKSVVLWIRLLSFVDNHETSSGCLKSIGLEAPWVCVPKEGPWKS